MKTDQLLRVLLSALSVLILAPACAQVHFDQIAVGTRYGSTTGYSSGDHAFTEDGIKVSVHDFTNGYSYAEIQSAKPDFGSANIMQVRHMNAEFDFTDLSFSPGKVTFEFLDTAREVRMSVNSSPLHTGQLRDPASWPAWPDGITMRIEWDTYANNELNTKGKVTLEGPVRTLRVGGSEFWLDDIIVRK